MTYWEKSDLNPDRGIKLLSEWGFSSFSESSFLGVTRRVTFVKGALLGEVARYHAEDTILWLCGTSADRDALWRSIQPKKDVQTQRYLFLLQEPVPIQKMSSFFLGFKGYKEFYSYWPSQASNKRITDLEHLVRQAFFSPKI